MSNRLAMDKAQSIQHLHDLGWSQRKIAATLSVDRKSVKRNLKSNQSPEAEPCLQYGRVSVTASRTARRERWHTTLTTSTEVHGKWIFRERNPC